MSVGATPDDADVLPSDPHDDGAAIPAMAVFGHSVPNDIGGDLMGPKR